MHIRYSFTCLTTLECIQNLNKGLGVTNKIHADYDQYVSSLCLLYALNTMMKSLYCMHFPLFTRVNSLIINPLRLKNVVEVDKRYFSCSSEIITKEYKDILAMYDIEPKSTMFMIALMMI